MGRLEGKVREETMTKCSGREESGYPLNERE
jgi:hypothetical protein